MHQGSVFKCLVVEDEALIRRNIARKVRRLEMGFAVVGEAIDGADALQQISRVIPHVMLTDIRMPGMDGMELIKSVHRDYPKVQVVVISAFADFEYARQAMRFGVSDYLVKPVTMKDLASVLERLRLRLENEKAVLGRIARDRPTEMSPEELAALAEGYIREHFRENISAGDIARQLLVTPEYLSRVFKRSAGRPPVQYLIHLRISEASRLLREEPELSIKNVAEMVGYADPYYFSRIFKLHTGQYPSEHRQAF